MHRRFFLGTLLWGSVGVTTFGAFLPNADPVLEKPSVPLRAVFSDVSSARQIGTRLIQSPDLPTPETLLRRRAPWNDRVHQSRSAQRQTINQELRSHMRRDYENGRTIVVDGWVLSMTEAQLCVWAAVELS